MKFIIILKAICDGTADLFLLLKDFRKIWEAIRSASFNSTVNLKNLWKLRDPEHLTIVIAYAGDTKGSIVAEKERALDGGTNIKDIRISTPYKRPSTGFGQGLALAHSVISLEKMDRKFKIKKIILSGEERDSDCNKDLLLLGGYETNAITREFFNTIEEKKEELLISRASKKIKRNGCEEEIFGFKWLDKDDVIPPREPYFAKENKSGAIDIDYGIIIRNDNPFNVGDNAISNNKSTCIVFAGCHTYGTAGAAIFFTDILLKIEQLKGLLDKKRLEMIVSVPVRNRCIDKENILLVEPIKLAQEIYGPKN